MGTGAGLLIGSHPSMSRISEAEKLLSKRKPKYDEAHHKGEEPHPAQAGSPLLAKGLQNLPHSFGKECIRKGFQNEGQPKCTEKKLAVELQGSK